MALGEQHLALGNTAKARELFEAAIAANGGLDPARESFAVLLLKDGDSTRVIQLLEPIYQRDPNRYEVLALLGEAHFQKKEYSKVTEVLEKAITLRRATTPVLNMLGISLLDLGDTERAQEMLERSLDLDPEQPRVKELLEKIKSGL
jgi:Flp pilus assembly protein TadD